MLQKVPVYGFPKYAVFAAEEWVLRSRRVIRHSPAMDARLRRVEESALAEAHVARVTDDEVIEDVDAEEFASSRKASRDLVVLRTRRRVAAGVIVREDDRRRVRENRRFEHFARVNDRAVERATTDLVIADHLMLRRKQ